VVTWERRLVKLADERFAPFRRRGKVGVRRRERQMQKEGLALRCALVEVREGVGQEQVGGVVGAFLALVVRIAHALAVAPQ
jgi:hypothetical protein